MLNFGELTYNQIEQKLNDSGASDEHIEEMFAAEFDDTDLERPAVVRRPEAHIVIFASALSWRATDWYQDSDYTWVY